MNADARREVIIQAAIRLFTEYGYDNTKIEDIAVAAGCTTGPVYHFFSGKEDIFDAAYNEVGRAYWGLMRESLQRDTPPIDKIIDICHQFYELPAKQVSEFTRSGLRILGYREVFARQRFVRDTIADLLRAAMMADEIDPAPPEPFAHLIVGMTIEGLALVGISDRPEAAVVQYKTAISKFILSLRNRS
jgi:AcrR family transcriptional regulator